MHSDTPSTRPARRPCTPVAATDGPTSHAGGSRLGGDGAPATTAPLPLPFSPRHRPPPGLRSPAATLPPKA